MVMEKRHSLASEAILGQRSKIAAALVELVFSCDPEHGKGIGNLERLVSIEEAEYQLSFLGQALSLNNQAVFVDYVAWAKVIQSQREPLATDLSVRLESLVQVLQEKLPGEHSNLAVEFVEAAIRAMPSMPEDLPTFLHGSDFLSLLAYRYFEALRRGERQLASRMVLDAVAAGTSVKDIYLHVFQTAQYEIGRLWQTNRMTIAEEHYCTAATQLIMSQLYSHIFATAKNGQTLVATCVSGDLHEIGVRMVADFFEMEGWNTYYLGSNINHEDIIATIIEHQADVLAISATICFHVDTVRELIQAVRENPATTSVKILTGGYPFNRDPDLWRKVGADGFATNAEQAITLANQLVQESPS
jgi:methanogenic corrinoid protein MtbC1